MVVIAALAAGLLGLITLAHVAGAFRFLTILSRPRETFEPESWPRVSILIGLRGADPYLADSLRKMFALDYPDYEVRLVVDSREDPAWDLVGRIIDETGATHAHREEFLDRPEDGIVNCTTSKQVQALRTLDERVQIVTMADGDLVPHPTWLKELVRPLLADAGIGATFGGRWFLPKDGRWGSLARALWNQAAVFQAAVLNLPWGGCFAIRADAIREGNLLEEWSRSLAFDAAAPRQLRQQGLRVEFVPHLLMPNIEECSVPFSINWVRRQLTWVKLYHTNFWAVVVQTGVITLAQLLAVLLLAAALISGSMDVAGLLSSALIAHFVVLQILCVVLNIRAARIIRSNGGAAVRMSPLRALKLLVAVPLVQFVQRVAVWQTLFSRRVTWRGLTLEVAGPHDIRIVGAETAPRLAISADESL